jgi:hypothetical protein
MVVHKTQLEAAIWGWGQKDDSFGGEGGLSMPLSVVIWCALALWGNAVHTRSLW